MPPKALRFSKCSTRGCGSFADFQCSFVLCASCCVDVENGAGVPPCTNVAHSRAYSAARQGPPQPPTSAPQPATSRVGLLSVAAPAPQPVPPLPPLHRHVPPCPAPLQPEASRGPRPLPPFPRGAPVPRTIP